LPNDLGKILAMKKLPNYLGKILAMKKLPNDLGKILAMKKSPKIDLHKAKILLKKRVFFNVS
jgi:hypothetical protein